ncbi:MAG: hypothetical protein LBD41_05255, partial [Clostridiales Family XIII bacterium]|nr:hypothetical protein [Clostridiales Family XIII bacterium]
GGSAHFVAPGESISKAVSLIFNRIRHGKSSDIKVDWGCEPIWASANPLCVYNNETLNLYALTKEKPLEPPTLTWKSPDGPQEVKANEIYDSTEKCLPRLVAFKRLNSLERDIDKKELALKYQLITKYTSYFLVHQRQGDKALSIPFIYNVPQMSVSDDLDFVARQTPRAFYKAKGNFKPILSLRTFNNIIPKRSIQASASLKKIDNDGNSLSQLAKNLFSKLPITIGSEKNNYGKHVTLEELIKNKQFKSFVEALTAAIPAFKSWLRLADKNFGLKLSVFIMKVLLPIVPDAPLNLKLSKVLNEAIKGYDKKMAIALEDEAKELLSTLA